MSACSKALTAVVASATLALGMAGPATAQPWRDGPDRGGPMMMHGGGQRFAVDQCRRAATDAAMRGATNAGVKSIDYVQRTGDGFRVGGKVAIYRHGGGYGRSNYVRTDFTCRTDGGRVVAVRIGGHRW